MIEKPLNELTYDELRLLRANNYLRYAWESVHGNIGTFFLLDFSATLWYDVVKMVEGGDADARKIVYLSSM